MHVLRGWRMQAAPNLGVPDEKAGFGHFDHLHVGRMEGHNMGNALASGKIRNKNNK